MRGSFFAIEVGPFREEKKLSAGGIPVQPRGDESGEFGQRIGGLGDEAVEHLPGMWDVVVDLEDAFSSGSLNLVVQADAVVQEQLSRPDVQENRRKPGQIGEQRRSERIRRWNVAEVG